ncbi:MAG TPA: D-alanyl-D-alanine carboxypeptidase/D-alanyl-D-alanine-endopeptidase, partial [Longimicrobiales bacterium]|nr:D-alanyl-D-alanine carboxypeptidase/D-alanyl-D-alanine-endopeptidase [Longimicrobiales bacterium]
VVVVNRSVTTEALGAGDEDERRGPRVRMRGAPGNDTLVVEGMVPLDADARPTRRAVGNPATYAAHALAESLRRRGITVDGEVRVSFEPVPTAGASRIATWHSPPLSEIVHGLMRPSQTWITEHLATPLGAERGERGSWGEGLDVVEDFLVEVAGVEEGSVSLSDGSGLSSRNLVAPESLVRLLTFARTQPWGELYYEALPPAGGDGTLRSRMQELGERVHAKTGTIANVNGLSGYVTTDDGRLLIFSVMTNATGRSSGVVRSGMDRIVEAVAAGAR